jgi:type VI secretion system secreted protein VgrG
VKPWESSYACFANNPIWFSDVNGDDGTQTSSGNGYMTGDLNNVVVRSSKLDPDKKDDKDDKEDDGKKSSGAGGGGGGGSGGGSGFSNAHKYTSKFEGGWSNDPIDPGGATNRGIIYSNFKRWAKNDLGIEGTMSNLKQLSAHQAEILYKKHYWDSQNLDDFNNASLAFAIYDFSVNSGRGISQVEKAFNQVFGGITVNSKLNKDEIAMLNTIDSKQLFDIVQKTRLSYLQSQIDKSVLDYKKSHPNATQSELNKYTNMKFQKGWFNRVNSITF